MEDRGKKGSAAVVHEVKYFLYITGRFCSRGVQKFICLTIKEKQVFVP